MQLEIVINGIKQEKTIPEKWADVTWEQYLKVKGNFVKTASFFTGVEETTLKKAKINNLQLVVTALKFLETPIKEEELKLPETILGFKVPKSLDMESIGQYADLQDITKKFDPEKPLENLALYPSICAIYCVKPYDFEQAEALAPQFLNAPCTEVMAVANFTYEKLRELRTSKPPTSPPEVTPKTK